jgi:chemotaxis protein histidine kinase CheA
MEKKVSDDEIRDLENEIDSAVDRLFRDKTGEFQYGDIVEPRVVEPVHIPPAPQVSAPQPEPIERLETQLLQLEWDVTGENLLRTEEEVQILKKGYREDAPVSSVLGLMEGVLRRMIEDSDNIDPSLIRFLLDSKDTLKLLLKDEEGEIKTYQQLARDGLEARFSLIDGKAKVETEAQTEAPFTLPDARQQGGPAPEGWERLERMFDHLRSSSDRMEGTLARVEQELLRLTEGAQAPRKELPLAKSPSASVTVFKANGRLFGLENDKVYKVFKVPETFHERYSGAERIRLKDIEVKMVDLRKIFSLGELDEGREGRILLAQEDGEYKGFLVEEILKKVSGPLLQTGGATYKGYCAGTLQWRYADHPVEIPVLDLKKF